MSVWDSEHDWSYFAERSENFGRGLRTGLPWPRGRMLGGSGGLNAMQYFRGFPHDYDSWEEMGNRGWGFRQVRKVFERMENNQGLNLTYGDRALNGPLRLNYFLNPQDTMKQMMMSALNERGYPTVEDFNNEKDQIGVTNIYGNFADGLRQSSARAYLIPAGLRPNLHVVKNAQVARLRISEGRVEDVEFTKEGGRFRIGADKEVILSGGTIGSAQILMLSGIGPRDNLEEVGVPVVMDLPVGENLQDHVYIPMHFGFSNFTQSVPAGTNLDNAYRYLKERTGPLSGPSVGLIAFLNTQMADRPNVQIVHAFYPRGSSEFLRSYYGLRRYNKTYIDQMVEVNSRMATSEISIVLSNPESRGNIKLRTNLTRTKPAINANYFDELEDMRTIVDILKIYHGLENTRAFRMAGSEFIEFDTNCDNYPSDEYWECYARHFTATLYHPVGTVKMGPDSDPKAVVDDRLRVRGIRNLRVCDASIMPRIISVNTNAASMMIGERCGDLIRDRFVGKQVLA